VTVWVLTDDADHEGSIVYGVFSDSNAAKAYVVAHRDPDVLWEFNERSNAWSSRQRDGEWVIQAWTINEPDPR
jgi:hypothetical protein